MRNINFRYRITTLAAINAWLLISFVIIFSLARTNIQNENNYRVNAATPIGALSSPNLPTIDSVGGSPTFKLFTPGWRGFNISSSDKFSEIFGKYDPAKVHSINAQAKSYVYTLGPYVTAAQVPCNLILPSQPNYSKCGKTPLPSSAIAKDSTGKAVYATAFTNNFLIVPNDPAWLNYLASYVPKVIKYNNTSVLYDGLFSDSMGTSPVVSNYLNAKPINPNTGNIYTAAEWIAANKVQLAKEKSVLPAGKTLMLNGLSEGARYWTASFNSSTRALVPSADGVMAERIFRTNPSSPLNTWPSTSNWLLDVRMIEDVEATYHKNGYWWSKCWSTSSNSCVSENNPSLLNQWRRFALGSYLLGAGAHSYFNWDTSRDDGNAAEYNSDYDFVKSIGTATVARAETSSGSGVWKRTFSKGLVIVNSTSAAARVSLGGTYKVSGATTSITSLSVPPHSGELLASVTTTTGGGNGSGSTSQTKIGGDNKSSSKNSANKDASSGQNVDPKANTHGLGESVKRLLGINANGQTSLFRLLLVPFLLLLVIWAGLMYWNRKKTWSLF